MEDRDKIQHDPTFPLKLSQRSLPSPSFLSWTPCSGSTYLKYSFASVQSCRPSEVTPIRSNTPSHPTRQAQRRGAVFVEIAAEARSSAKSKYIQTDRDRSNLREASRQRRTASDESTSTMLSGRMGHVVCRHRRALCPEATFFPSPQDKHSRLLDCDSQRPIWCFLSDLHQIFRRKHCAYDEITIC